MPKNELLILKGPDVESLLAGKEEELIAIVRRAYEVHAETNQSSLPHSVFLRFPGDAENRIIALPGYLGDGFDVAGVKWIASFPRNIKAGMDRSSGVLILNSPQTGIPEAVIETSIISTKRTAASAALAAQAICDHTPWLRLGVIGCGLINFEIVRFLRGIYPSLQQVDLVDTDHSRAIHFREKLQLEFGAAEITIRDDVNAVLAENRLVSLATAAVNPHISDLSGCQPGTVILHVSLRDLSAEAIVSCDNIVDDVEHVCRAETSVHLAEKLTGGRQFITGTLAEAFRDRLATQRNPGKVTVFSPFGLGILDLAVGAFALDLGRRAGRTIAIPSFLAPPWTAPPTHQTD